MAGHSLLETYLKNNPGAVGKVVDYNAATDKLLPLDFTAANTELTLAVVADTSKFTAWVNDKLREKNSRYGIGGYLEHRSIYAVSGHFDTVDEPRRLHLGVDIWGAEGTRVYAPFDGVIHSFKNNDNFGDYGPTIILQHNLAGLVLYSLYGHLSQKSLAGFTVGDIVNKNQRIAWFGNNTENGCWPPHLHFQLMYHLEGNYGDYPGVCKYSEMEKYKLNVPDPGLVMGF